MIYMQDYNVLYDRLTVELFIIIFITIIYAMRIKGISKWADIEISVIYLITIISICIDVYLWAFNIEIKYITFYRPIEYHMQGNLISVFHYIYLVGIFKIYIFKDKHDLVKNKLK